ncbi:MAG TPA: P-loop NTPase fold protein [Actinocrinis sp.]|jgi:DNA-binding response OmpR family regulator
MRTAQTRREAAATDTDTTLTLLSDQPVSPDGQQDLLGRAGEADRLADLLRDSRAAAPFTLAVHAEWGMGKSSLLRQTAQRLRQDPDTEVVWFNAWTAGGSGLEGLIKSVLDRLDPRSLRRLARAVSGESAAASWARVLVRGLAGTVRLHHLVDGIWDRLAVDARTRNNAQDLLRQALSDWTGGVSADRRRTIVVFVDDLDRCPADAIRVVCEAIKQYLNVPGLVFVFGCDRSIVEAAVAGPRVAAGDGREFLEKIIQASYPIAAPDDAQVAALISGYAHSAGAGALFQGAVAEAVAQYAGRNPRRIKQLINRFVVEYRLDPEWSSSFGAGALIRAALLQDLYPGFHRLLAQSADRDPLEELRGYVEVLKVARSMAIGSEDGEPGQDDRERAARFIAEHEVPTRDRGISAEDVARLEQELPEGFPVLARDKTFLGLVEALTGGAEGAALRVKLRRTRLDLVLSGGTTGVGQAVQPPPTRFAGLRVLWLRDPRDPDPLLMPEQVALQGGQMNVVDTVDAALEYLADERPSLVVINLRRPSSRSDGFGDVAAIRRRGYGGPIVICSTSVTPGTRERAEKYAALITDDPRLVMAWIGDAANDELPAPGRFAPVRQPRNLEGLRVLWLAPYPNVPLTNHLEARGAEVRSASNLAEGLRMALEQPPDAVVADPFVGADGEWRVYGHIQELRNQASYAGPVILLAQRLSEADGAVAARMDVWVATDDLVVMTRALVRIAREKRRGDSSD